MFDTNTHRLNDVGEAMKNVKHQYDAYKRDDGGNVFALLMQVK